MNLPFVLDIALGLIFIYLVLSLLASEIQELLATLLQWRAKHLKESIENLFEGSEDIKGREETEAQKVKKLVKRLYDDPLLENINQEARGFIENLFRKATWFLPDLYRRFTKKENGAFGDKRSGPSYISSETFATTLVETLGISVLIEELVKLRLQKFVKRIIESIKDIAKNTGKNLDDDKSFELLNKEFSDVINNFKENKATIITSIERLSESLDRYIKYELKNNNNSYTNGIQSITMKFFGLENERAIISGGLKPSLTEIVELINTSSKLYGEIAATIEAKDDENYKQIKKVIEDLPQSVQASLAILARRAKAIQKTENEIDQLIEEISIWFDRSMARASGVYKRNAKGVSILIGLVIAFAINADTFHIFNRLSSNETLRQVITARASQITLTSPNSEIIERAELEKIKAEIDSALKDISLPIGWNTANLSQQLGCNYFHNVELTNSSSNSASEEWSLLFSYCLPKDLHSFLLPRQIIEMIIAHPWATLKMIAGWFLSGIAIAMGAPFWFDLLGKVVNVRNSGNKPSSANQANPK